MVICVWAKINRILNKRSNELLGPSAGGYTKITSNSATGNLDIMNLSGLCIKIPIIWEGYNYNRKLICGVNDYDKVFNKQTGSDILLTFIGHFNKY